MDMKQIKKFTGMCAALAAAAIFATGCASTEDSRSAGQVLDDTALHTMVKAALVNDPVVSGTSINVDVERGVVSLAGAVNGEVAKRKAEEIARGVEGVRSVENKLVVREYPDSGSTTNAPRENP